jgi:hypothetical protein
MSDERKAPSADEDENEGEGNKSADERYRRNVEEFIEEDDPDARAREAASDVERDPERYREAERVGKSRIAEEDEKDKELI